MGMGLGTGRPIQPVSTPSDTRMRREMSAKERGPKLSTWRAWGGGGRGAAGACARMCHSKLLGAAGAYGTPLDALLPGPRVP